MEACSPLNLVINDTMVTQRLEFNSTTGNSLTAKLFAFGSDVLVASVLATEKTNDKNRYVAEFTDIPAGEYRLNGFVGGDGGFANAEYDLLLVTGTYYPRSEMRTPTREEATSDKDEVLAAIDGVSVVVQPLQGTQTHRLQGSDITVKIREKVLIGFNVQDVDGNPVDLDALTLEIRIQSLDRATTITIPNADISRSGDSFTFRLTTAVTAAVREWTWSLRETEYDGELIGGSLAVVYAP